MAVKDLSKQNRGKGATLKVPPPMFPNADEIVRQGLLEDQQHVDMVDILLVNPPSPDGDIWIRSQHRVGRRTRENMIWPQVSLAQMAALLHPTYSVKIVDAIAERMGWPEFTKILDKYQPRFYMTQVTAPTLENDMYGAFLAKARGAYTIAFGTHVTPIPKETLRSFPALDFVLVGEPDLTIRDLMDYVDQKFDQRPANIQKLFADHDPSYKPSLREAADSPLDFSEVKGIAWRKDGESIVNPSRPFIHNLSDLPLPPQTGWLFQTYTPTNTTFFLHTLDLAISFTDLYEDINFTQENRNQDENQASLDRKDLL